MGDRAEFELLLKDKVSRPAARGASAVDKLLGVLGKKSGADKQSARALAQQVRLNDRMSRSIIRQSRITERQSKTIIRQTKLLDRQARVNARAVLPRGGRGSVGVGSVGGGGRSGGGGESFFGGMLKWEGAKAATKGLADFALRAGKAANDVQRFEMAFAALSKGKFDPNRLFTHVRAQAEEYGLGVQKTSEQYLNFLAQGFTPRDADELLGLGADLKIKNTAEEIEGVFLALTQIKSKGRLQGEELLQLAERKMSLGGILDAIGESLGKNKEEVRKLMEGGKIDSELAIDSIKKAHNKLLGQERTGQTGKRISKETIGGNWDRAKAMWENLEYGLGKRNKDRITSVVSGLVDDFEKWIKSEDAALFMDEWGMRIDRVTIGVKDATKFARELVGEFRSGSESASGIESFLNKMSKSDTGETANTLRDLARVLGWVGTVAGGLASVGLMAVRASIDAMLSPVKTVIEMFDNIGKIWNDESKGWAEKAVLIGWESAYGLGKGFLQAAYWPVQAVWTVGKKVLENLDLIEPAKDMGRRAVEALADGIMGMVGLPGQAIRKVMSFVVGSAKDEIDMHSPPRVFLEMGRATPEAYALGIERRSRVAEFAAVGVGAKASAGFSLGLGIGERQRPRDPLLDRPRNVIDLGEKRRKTFEDPPVFGFDCGPMVDPSTPVFREGCSLSISAPITFTVDASGATDGEGIAEAISSRLEPELEALFDRVAEALGAA